MYDVLKELMKDEIEKDVNAAKEAGAAENQKKIILTMKRNGFAADTIASATGIDLKEVQAVFAE